VRNAKHKGLCGDGGGLFLQVGASGGKSWIFRWKEAGKMRVMGLGPVHTVSLAEARDKALACRKLRLEGIDPIEQRREKRAEDRLAAAKGISFRECAEGYIAAHRAGWRNDKHAAQWPSTLAAYVYPMFSDLAVQAIDTGLVMRTLEPIWNDKPETASRVRGRIESVLDWASARGYRQGENPARWRGHLQNLLPRRSKVRRVEHHAALPYPEIGAFMAKLRQQEGVAARALEFAILTAARTGEVRGARWSEIDLDAKVWNIPASRMKANRPHRVPLSDAALSIVKAIVEIRQGDFVFPGTRANRPMSKTGLMLILQRMGRTDTTVHGLRSTFRDWAAERTGFPAEIAEGALAHLVGDAVERAYRRSDLFDRRRQMMDQWARFCEGPAGGEVVPLHASR
jgi:integrase